MIRLLISGLLILNISCADVYRSDYKFRCASQLSNRQINLYKLNSFKNYTENDLDLLADITTCIIEVNGDTSEFEIFYNQKTEKSLVLDVYWLENEEQIDSTTCRLFNTTTIKLPAQMIILFHQYKNGYEDGGIIVGLTNIN